MLEGLIKRIKRKATSNGVDIMIDHKELGKQLRGDSDIMGMVYKELEMLSNTLGMELKFYKGKEEFEDEVVLMVLQIPEVGKKD